VAISSEEYRDALRNFASGVTVVTIRAGEEIHGLTVSAFASVSPEPPLVLVVIDHRHKAHALLERADATFAVNILGQHQFELSNRFAWTKDEDRFQEGDWRQAATGAPVLADALAWLDCTVWARHSAGAHSIYIGEAQATQVSTDARALPLLYWNRGYRHFKPVE
jgi:flavin reductase (DIM6/NTAB) family NADH-FMN oxidoreductase RutF